jgi:DNA-binding NarL/FixJ family response regulator
MIRVGVDAARGIARAGIEALLGAFAEIELVESDPDVLLWQAGGGTEMPEGAAVIALTLDAAEALRSGAQGALPPDCSGDQLRAAIHAVAAGLLVLHPRDAAAVPAPEFRARPVEALTPREAQVLGLIADGLSNKEIAARLAISDHTVKFHVASLLGKLGVSTRAEAVSVGLRQGLILL